jgi:Flp pilus assembly protein TadD
MRAQARVTQGDQAGAEADLREATRLAPDLAYLWVRLGSFLAGQGRLVEARRALAQAVARAPEDKATRVLLAVTLETAGDHEAAVATLRSLAGRESAEQLLARMMQSGLGSAPQPNRRP